MKITMNEYINHCNDYDGFCLACEEFTCGGVEPDAEGYLCEMCGENKVMGTEDALISGHIEVL